MVRSFFIGILLGILATAGDKDDKQIYSPTGKRDPFRASVVNEAGRELANLSELERYAVEQFSLRAILRTNHNATALFEDPEGKTHILAEGEFLGRERGRISRILQHEVIVTVQTKDYLGSEKPYDKHLVLPDK